VDLELNCLQVNESWTLLTGLSSLSSLNHGWLAAFYESGPSDAASDFPRSLSQCAHYQKDFPVVSNTKEKMWFRAHAAVVDNIADRYLLVFFNVSEFMAKEQHLESVAQIDSLTGLLNRRAFYTQFSLALRGVGRLGSVALMFVDLDGFKQINDQFGHDVGDELLKEVSKRLRKSLRKVDLLARVGGDEFTIALTHVEEVRSIVTVANKILQSLSSPIQLSKRSVFISCSIGIALAQDERVSIDTVIKQADTALYDAKGAGKNQFKFFTPALNHSAKIEAQLRASLLNANNRDLRVVFQPQIDTSSNRIVAIEALARWQHEGLGSVSADSIIRIMEDAGLINDFSKVLFNQAFHSASRWRQRFDQDIKIAVNLSARQVRDRDLAISMFNIAKRHGLQPSDVILEINESALANNAELATESLTNARRMGFHISLDDYGSGVSSLSTLMTLPLDSVKIDGYFIADAAKNPEHAKTVIAVLDLAKSLNLTVIAEGVETRDTQNWLIKQGCNYQQGHFHYTATNQEKIEKLISNHLDH
jgi:diguanylate cyclase (GGDEF)-like protein